SSGGPGQHRLGVRGVGSTYDLQRAPGEEAGRMSFVLVAVLGLIIGSFLNVVVARLPEHQSLLGRSVCPRCAAQIEARDNIPLLSFILLRGRCRACRGRISWRYPMIELGTAAALLAAFARFGPT